MLFTKKEKTLQKFYESVSADGGPSLVSDKEQSLDFLVRFFNDIRPHRLLHIQDAEKNMQAAIRFIETNPGIADALKNAILVQLVNTKLEAAFTKSGIPTGAAFSSELFRRLKFKILPPEPDKQDFLYVLGKIFYRHDDYTWVNAIKRSTWISFFELLQFPLQSSDERLKDHLMDALTVLSFQVANSGLDAEVLHYVPAFITEKENPFIIQSRLILELQNDQEEMVLNISLHCAKVRMVLYEIENLIAYIRQNQAVRGASINQSYLLLILSVRLQRMLLLLDMFDNNDSFDIGSFTDLFKIMVRNENRKYSTREFVSEAVGYIAYQIAEHKGVKGSKYITTTRKEYVNMLVSAMQGGAIISLVAIFKNLLGKLHLAYFWQGFWYSVNYSLGFIVIDQSGSTLATKQPAFTANAVAVSLDSKKNIGGPDLENLGSTIAKVIRSQTASFIGNLVIVFPGTYFLAMFYHKVFGVKIAEGTAALNLLKDQHPFLSLSLLYACNTGVFLFLSGIIAGYVQNKVLYSNVSNRLAASGSFQMIKSKRKRERLAHFISDKAGMFAGNIGLGFFLGMAALVGKVFGIPFDIRHITISSGNMAIGVYGLGFENIPTAYLLTVFLGVLGIGFFNFLVSFSLAFFVAVKSRGIKLKQYPRLMSIIFAHFVRKPHSFIFPPGFSEQS